MPSRFFRIAFALAAAALAQAPATAPAQGQPQAEPPKMFGNWALQCATAQSGARSCTLNQVFVQNETKRQVLRLSLIHSKTQNTDALVIVAPLGSDLSRNPTFSIPGLPAAAPSYRYCMRDGCYASIPVGPALLAEMQKGGTGQVGFLPFRGQSPVTLQASFQGFAEGYAALLAAQ